LEEVDGTNRFGYVGVLDPYRFIREAEVAIISGNRKVAVALIAQAYFAFDLLAVDCNNAIKTPDIALQERNN
jgi:hypothetical protein